MGRPRKDGTPARKPVKRDPEDPIRRIRSIYDEMVAVIGESVTETGDFAGISVAVRYGFLCRIVDELGLVLRQERRR